MVKLSERATELFTAYARDAGNWSGNPMVGGNVPSNGKSDRGYILALKRQGLITTYTEYGCVWIVFTDKGLEYASTLGIKVCLPH
jgi:hypothetical protein